MVQDYLGLNPRGSVRIEWGGATGGEGFQAAYEAVASGRMDVCLAAGFETMSRVATWKGNEFIALASDTNYDFPLGGFYTGYYALMVIRHIYKYHSTTKVRPPHGRTRGPAPSDRRRKPHHERRGRQEPSQRHVQPLRSRTRRISVLTTSSTRR